jgi:hypothetical protein
MSRAFRVSLLFAVACGKPEITPDKEPKGEPYGPTTEGQGTLRSDSVTFTTEANSRYVINVDVERGETDMLLTLTTGDEANHVYFYQVIDPEGTLVYDGDKQFHKTESLSYACWPDQVSSLNWPIVDDHGALREGRWSIVVSTLDARTWNYKGGVEVRLDAAFSQDPSFDAGSLTVNMVYTGGLQDDASLVEAVAVAEERWRQIYAAVGVDVVFTTTSWPGDGLWEPPSVGSYDQYEEVMANNEPGVLNLVLVPEFSGQGGQWTLGLAGGIPGAMVPTAYSAVAVNVAAHMGPDLVWDGEEVRIMAGTMAHELGHYLGMFHPVEDGYQYWDALDDTPPCSTRQECDAQLGSNLMYWITLCDRQGCDPQEDLTADQKGVMQRYVGVE